MSHADFVHLRVHTAYSLTEGAIRVGKLGDLCQRYRMPAVAITDTNNLFGALEFSKEMAGKGIQPILGCQLSLARADLAQPSARNLKKPDPDKVVLLAQTEAGYANLMKLSTKAYLEPPPGEVAQIQWADLEACAEGVICLTGGPSGPIARLVLDGQIDAAREQLKTLAGIFPGRTYVELQRHGWASEAKSEPGLLDLAYELNLPLVATNDCYFPDEDMYVAHDALLCIAEGSYVGEQNRRRVTPDHRFKSAEEMRVLFADLPEAIDNTLVIARRCAVKANERAPILPNFGDGTGESEADMLRRMAREGLELRLQQIGVTDPEKAKVYHDRLDFECDTIIGMKFPGYFLIVADFIQWSKRNGIAVGPGRGSGAGSVVAWALTITDLDPLRFGLLFERFLNPERVSMPDFDIDFCQERREEVIHYVQDKYGSANVAQIITFGKLQARAALRDVGRVLQLPLGQVDRICKLIPNNPANPVTLAQAIKEEVRLREERDRDENVARMMDVALKLEGLYRNASTHAAGVVIGDRPLVELVPLYRDPHASMPATQFSMKYAEAAGLVKFDFLGLKTLDVLEKAINLIRLRGVNIELAEIPLSDQPTFNLLGRGDAVGVFQFEGSGMRDMLRNMKPDAFEDLIALVALYRPGPMENIPSYIARKHGKEKPDYLHDWLKPVLEETYGVIIYQEQVMEIAKVLAGYSLGDADLLRRAMGKKIKAEMDAQKDRFVNGAKAKGVDPERAAFIFELVEKFAGYGFNKSHAAAYALVAWHTAYLKANYPVEFIAGSMTLDISNTDKLNVFRQECARQGITLLPPDINKSLVEFSVEYDRHEKGAIRYALSAVRNVGAAPMAVIVAEREKNGPFKSLFDFASRVDPAALNKRMLENLAKAGAFDHLEKNRARVIAGLETLIRFAQSKAEERNSNQVNLFGGGKTEERLPKLPEGDIWTPMDQLAKEFEAIGFYLSAHPLDAYQATLNRVGVKRYTEALKMIGASESIVKLAGTVISKQERTSQKTGNRFAFVQCSDASGMYEVMLFSEILAQHRDMLEAGTNVVWTLSARADGEQPRLSAQKIEKLDDVAARAAAGIKILIEDDRPLAQIRTLLDKAGKGRGQVMLGLQIDEAGKPDIEADIKLKETFAINPATRHQIRVLPGVREVYDI
ncbi:DNA polymerase III subunit alpha [Ferrovibrio terrae]|uniref:DNA polymerase III subunit alpha n=1 Tax=Ferrovibrio terrae TaxID=2594003 RepID=A0A516H5M6_9PROT|nr:DNA polymerase III subunit alpha [Ferrovibrio terrae]QDO98980.1 DNA polymerase III subunit alpha [Ferrovibrio terrae]